MCFARAEAVAAEAETEEDADTGVLTEGDTGAVTPTGAPAEEDTDAPCTGSLALLLALVLLPDGSSKDDVLPADAAAALDGRPGSLSAAAGPITGSRCAATSLTNSAK
jgi:hypothetical protein